MGHTRKARGKDSQQASFWRAGYNNIGPDTTEQPPQTPKRKQVARRRDLTLNGYGPGCDSLTAECLETRAGAANCVDVKSVGGQESDLPLELNFTDRSTATT